MRENEYKDFVNQKCLESTMYGNKNNHGYDIHPQCPYYDLENNKCTLNGCIKNTKKKDGIKYEN